VEDVQRLAQDLLDEAVAPGVVDAVGIRRPRVFRQLQVLAVPEHPLGVARAVYQRDRLDEALPAQLDESPQVLLRDRVRRGDLRVGIPARRLTLDDGV